MTNRCGVKPRGLVLAAVATWCFGHPALVAGQQGWLDAVITISDTLPAYPGQVGVAVNGSGDVVAAWGQGASIWAARYAGADGGWGQPVNLSSETSAFLVATVAIDAAGNALTAWASGNAVRAARYTAATGTWETPVSVAPATFPGNPDVAMDASGNATIVWGDSGRIKVSRYSAAGNTWEAPVDISAGGAPRIAVDAVGNAIVLSTEFGWDARAVRAMHYTVDSGTWGGLIELGAVSQLADAPQIAFDAAGNAVAMWSGFTTGPTFVAQAARYVAATGEWGGVTTLGSAAGPPSGVPSLAVAATGDAVAAWTAPGGLARASRYSVATGWSASTDVSATGAGAEVWDVGVDARGHGMVLWTQADRRTYVALNTGPGGAWTAPSPLSISGLLSFHPQVAVQPAGNATVMWGAGVPGCPPACDGAVQSRRWVAAPAAPAVSSVSASTGLVTVGFTAPPTTAPSFAPTNYAYSVDDGATWTTRDPASTASPLVIGGLTDGLPYTLRLRGINDAGLGLPTPPLAVRAGSGSDAPTGLVETAKSGNIVTIAWTPPEVGIVPALYILEGGVNAGEVLASIPTGSTAPTFTFVAPTGAFYIRVHAASGGVRSAASNEIRIFVNVPAPPSAPANLLGLVNGSSVALSWVNTFGGGAPTSLWLNVTGAVSTVLPLPFGEAFTFAGVPPGTYTLSVIAANASGASAPSNEVTLTFPGACTGVPDAPVDFQAWRAGSTIFVSWSPPASGPAVTRYTVQVGGAFVGGFTTTERTLSGRGCPGHLHAERRGRERLRNGCRHARTDHRDSVSRVMAAVFTQGPARSSPS